MPFKTLIIQLVAEESVRQALWHGMGNDYTQFVNKIQDSVAQDVNFRSWVSKGKLPKTLISNFGKDIRREDGFNDLPCRYHKSAQEIVHNNFKSYITIMQNKQTKVDSLRRWLSRLISDKDLMKYLGVDLVGLQNNGMRVLSLAQGISQSEKLLLHSAVFKILDNSEDNPKDYYGAVYLLKYGCDISKVDKEEDEKVLLRKQLTAETKIKRLEKQINGSTPRNRVLDIDPVIQGLEFIEEFPIMTDEQALAWQKIITSRPAILPFPLSFTSNTDLTWSKNDLGRFTVRFASFAHQHFEIRCGNRQLHWIQRFWEDQERKKRDESCSSSLFTLRSAILGWRKVDGKGNPWNVHKLMLYCCVDTNFWSAEGTELIRREKSKKVAKRIINNAKYEKSLVKEEQPLIKNTSTFEKQLVSTQNKLEKGIFNRPNIPAYHGEPNIIVGLSMGLEKPATAVIINAIDKTILSERNTKQLLGKDYRLLNRYREELRSKSRERKNLQRRGVKTEKSESTLGLQINRILAKQIVLLAKTYNAGSIALPELNGFREKIHSEVEARAILKNPDNIFAQNLYAKDYRKSIHSWNYCGLQEAIRAKANQEGLAIEMGNQDYHGTPQEKAKKLALDCFHFRKSTLK